MYELLIKLHNELDYKRYTVNQLEEVKKILKDLKTDEVRLKKVKEKK